MIKFIEKATAEFEQNGRSNLFIAMENRIIKTGKPVQIYFFARYAKGASATRLQKAIHKVGTAEQCYYFAKYVQGAQLRPAVIKMLEAEDKFWIEKMINFAHDNGRFGEISNLVMDFVPETKQGVLARKDFDSNDLIDAANQEYEQNGRSEYFQALEKYCLHSRVPADTNLFAQCVTGVNVKAFERAVLLKGDPFSMFMIATNVKGANVKLMREGLEMAKHDYVEIQRTDKDRLNKKLEILIQIRREKNSIQRKALMASYKRLPNISEYVARIENRYIPRVDYLVNKQELQKVKEK